MQEIKTEDASAKTAVPSREDGANLVKPLVTSVSPMKALFDKAFSDRKITIVLLAVVLLGVVTGLGLYVKRTAGTVRLAGRDVEIVNTQSEEGVKDASTFKDTATGKMTANDGKITTEGTEILVRGDSSQNVYLTSSVVDLSKYEGKSVQVWGETFQGQKAGWLMDVGRIKIVQ